MRDRARSLRYFALSAVLSVLIAAPALAQQPVRYRVSFPAPEHHYAQVEVIFSGVPAGPLEARMSRSSPGRYAVHEFSKNVFDLQVFDGKGRKLEPSRPHPSQWNVSGHDGTVRIVYKVFGLHVDGTYLAVDDTHAHMSMPATLMWARGFDMRPSRVTFEPPAGSKWKPATQLFPTEDPWTFTAPNLQYLMDSPTELSDYTLRSFKVRNPDGKEFAIHTAVHHDGDPSAIDEYAAGDREDRQRSRRGLRRVPDLRQRQLHLPRRLRPVGRRRRHGAPQQHGGRLGDLVQESADGPRRARHGLARVLPRLERRAHPAEVARAVQFRGCQHLRRAVAGGRVHAVLREPDHGARRPAGGGPRAADRQRPLRAQQSGAAVQVRRRDEHARAVHRRGGGDRPDEFFDDVHFVLHLRRGASRPPWI